MIETITGFILLALALFIPGYFLTLGFFAKKGEIDSIERIVFSFVFGITFLPLLVLAENQLLATPINFYSVGTTYALLIIAGLAAYLIRVNGIFAAVSKQEAVSLIPKLK